LNGNAGADLLDGGGANDYLMGGSGPDVLLGGEGADDIWGRGGADVLNGGADPDVLRAGFGIDECTGESLSSCEMTDVSPGDSGHSVRYLQKRLSRALLYRGPLNGVYPVDSLTRPGDMTGAVYAFHKLHRDPVGDAWTDADHVSDRWTIADWHLLESFDPSPPVDRPDEPNRIEVDAYHEVMWLVLDGEVAGVFHVSIGNEQLAYVNGEYRRSHTPRGDFDIDRYSLGTKTAGWQYKSWYFEQNYFAVHGFYKVPPFPASHGCVRVTYDEADWLTVRLEVGWPIHVWDE